MSKRKARTSPALSAAAGAPGTPGHPDYPPITAAQCKDLAFARRLVREMRSGHGGRRHQRDHLRRASRATHEMEAFKHLYHGTYTDHEQRARDTAPARESLVERVASMWPTVQWPPSRLDHQPDHVPDPARPYSDPHHPGWWCDWTPARDRAHAIQLQLDTRHTLANRDVRQRWQDCSIGDAVHARHFPIAADDPLADHPLVLHWPVDDHDTQRTFARIAPAFWARVA